MLSPPIPPNPYRNGTERGGAQVHVARAVAICLVLILAVGGAGTDYPLVQAAARTIAVVLLAAVIVLGAGIGRIGRIGWTERGLIAVALALPLLQLIPVGFAAWAGVPGRALPAAILSDAGVPLSARPISLDPGATLRAWFAVLPGIAVFVAGRTLASDGRRLAIYAVLAIAVASALLGAVQVVAGTGAGAPAYASSHLGQGIGLFVNRNHQAAFLLVAICLTATLNEGRHSPARLGLIVGLIVLFAAGVLATTSRTALVLLPLTLIPLLTSSSRALRKGVPVAGAVAAVIGLVAWYQGALGRIVARMADEPEMRIAFWQTTAAAVRSYWPVGSGIGSFPLVYPVFEDRAALSPFVVNHAHSDYLELLLEGGIVAALALLVFAGWFAWRSVQAWRAGDTVRSCASTALVVLLVYSGGDYPLRTITLMALFGLLCALLVPKAEQSGSPRRWLAPVAMLAALALGGAMLRDGWIEHRRLAGSIDGTPWPFDLPNGALASDAAATALQRGDAAGAAASARKALAARPLDQRAATVLAIARRAQGDTAGSARLLALAGRLGWRDPTTQLWLFGQQADAGDPAAAMARADALLRTGQLREATTELLRAGAGDPTFARALARMLAAGAPWRQAYMTDLADMSGEALAVHLALIDRVGATREERAALVSRAIANGAFAMAAEAWRRGTPTLLPDPAFTRVDNDTAARRGLFGWHATETGNLRVEPAAGGHGAVLVIDRLAAGPLLYQDVLLPPGTYAMTIDGAALPGWTVACLPGSRRIDAPPTMKDRRTVIGFTIPADCPVQRVALNGTAGGVDTIRVPAGAVTITPR